MNCDLWPYVNVEENVLAPPQWSGPSSPTVLLQSALARQAAPRSMGTLHSSCLNLCLTLFSTHLFRL